MKKHQFVDKVCTVLHRGHFLEPANHSSIQLGWKTCLHCSYFILVPLFISSKHILHYAYRKEILGGKISSICFLENPN